MGGWIACILQNLATSSGTALVAAGWDSIEYEGEADTPWLVDPDQTVGTN